MRDAAREQPQALQALRLDQLLLEQCALLHDLPALGHVRDYADDPSFVAMASRTRLAAREDPARLRAHVRESRLDLERLAERE